MTSLDAMTTLRRHGYKVEFQAGAWTVTLWEGYSNQLNKLELVELAKDLLYLEG